MRVQLFVIIILLLLIIPIALVSVAKLFLSEAVPVLTMEQLPKGAVYVSHQDEEKQAEEVDKIVMRHYGTPTAISTGGPIFGIMGWRIISVEYEIHTNDIPEKTIGQEFTGYLLDLPELKGHSYDHFHISYHSQSLHDNSEDQKDHGEGVYSIHFMFIPHKEELSYGLVCE